MSTAAVLAAAAPVAAVAFLPAAVPVSVFAAEVPPVVALCGTAWEKEWLRERDPQCRKFVELICELRHRKPSDDYEASLNTICNRMRENRDDVAAAKDIGDALPKPDLMSFEGMFNMAGEMIDTISPDRALTLAINGMRAARGRWGKDVFATANLNALLMAHAFTGLMLTGLGHPDFLNDAEKAEVDHA